MKWWESGTVAERINTRLTMIITFLTLINVAATVVYVRTVRKATRDTGLQTDKLIAAANVQSQAAGKMANASESQAQTMAELAREATSQAVATNALALQAKRSADAAKEGLQASADSSHEDRRAWVSAEIGEKSGKFFIAMHNTGKTPAVKVTYQVAFAPGKLGIIPKVDLSRDSSTPIDTKNMPPDLMERLKKDGLIPDHSLTGYVVAPGKSEISSYFGGEFSQIIGFPPDERMYIQGRLTYEDIFGGKHETRFCYWLASQADFPLCADNNYMN